ncbi:hypothetical protein L7F22_068795 [Adiantum nelumboides]|nr:hypothetical protein [Adiantum nelumboides]
MHTSTDKAPFEIVEEGKKVPPILQTKDKIFEANKYVQNVDEAYRKIKLALEKTQFKKKKAADCYRFELVFSLSDWEAYSHKTSVRPERRRQFQKELAASTQDAFQALTDQLSRNTQEYLDQILGAFAAWLHLSHGMQASILASHPLVAAALSGLTLDKSFDAAVDAVTELIRFTVSGSSGGLAEQMPLVQIILPHVMALRSRFAASLKIALADRQLQMKGIPHASDGEGEEKDLEVMKGVAQLFAELGESYVDLIANGSGEAMMIVEALVEVTSHLDDTIAEITYNFWYRLSSALSKRYSSIKLRLKLCIEQETVEAREQIWSATHSRVTDDMCFHLMAPFTVDELREAVHRGLFVTHWDIMHIWLLRGCQDIFASGYMSQSMCSRLISLIPNGGDTTRLRQWRPISLISSIYKILAKLISSRLRPFLPDLIHTSQTGFVQDRRILDILFCFHRAMDWARTSSTPLAILLLDFEKAYDRVDWGFLEGSLDRMGFPLAWIRAYQISEAGLLVGTILVLTCGGDNFLDVLDTIWYALEVFCVASGARINWDKSYSILAGSDDAPTWGPGDFTWLRAGETCRYLGFQVGLDVTPEQ